jgi:U3 small nucleolar RNA-associated protein 23
MQLQTTFERLVQALLGETTFLHVTECVLAELLALGDPARQTLSAAHTISVIRCRHKHGHKPGMDPADCLAALVGATNASHYLVATQDPELRRRLRAVPGTPIVLFSQNVLVLEPPSAASKGEHGETERAKAGISAEEAAAVRAAKLDLRSAPPVAPVLPLRLVSAPGTSATGPGERSSAGVEAPLAGVKRRRKSGGPSGPNPLSVKKRAGPPTPAPSGGGAMLRAAVLGVTAVAPHDDGTGISSGGATGALKLVRRRRKGSSSAGAVPHHETVEAS